MIIDLDKIRPMPKLGTLPISEEGSVRLAVNEGVPVFRSSDAVQARIEQLLLERQDRSLSAEEQEELDRYEEIDDFLSFVN